MAGLRWTSAAEAELMERLADGQQVEEIARALGRSHSAVQTKLFRLGLGNKVSKDRADVKGTA